MFKDGESFAGSFHFFREAEHLQHPVRAAMRPLLGGLRLHSLRGMHHRSTRLEEKRENGSTEDDPPSL